VANTTTDPGGTDPGAQSAVILVVEDNVINQKVAVGLLKRLGYQSEVAESGAKALDAVGQRQYALVLMDCQMPDMDGLETTRRLRSREPAGTHIPIVAMTGMVGADDLRRCLEAGMDDYLTKPILIDQLRAVLARWLATHGG
jgi:two-component system, sensor histidine kinase and response regulator